MGFEFDIIENELESILRINFKSGEEKSLSEKEFYLKAGQITLGFIKKCIDKGYRNVSSWVEIDNNGSLYYHISHEDKNDCIN